VTIFIKQKLLSKIGAFLKAFASLAMLAAARSRKKFG